MKRFLMLVALAVLIAVPQVVADEAIDQPGAETESRSEVQATVEEQAEGCDQGPELVEVSLEGIFGGLTLLAEKQEPEGLCVVCPLSYCRRPGVRCDYVNCSQQTCCTFSCYHDSSCTSGNPFCRSFDCGCRFIISLP